MLTGVTNTLHPHSITHRTRDSTNGQTLLIGRVNSSEKDTEQRERERMIYFDWTLMTTFVKQHESLPYSLDNNSALDFRNASSNGIVHEISFDWLISNDWSSIPIVRFHWYFSLQCSPSSAFLIEKYGFEESKQPIFNRSEQRTNSVTSRAHVSASVKPSWMLICRVFVPWWVNVCFRELNNDDANVSK